VNAIDPRLRQRRIAVRRAEGRRRLRVLLVVIAVLALGTGAYAVTQSRLLDLETVVVTGIPAGEQGPVREASALSTGTPMIELDLEQAASRVTALSWVASASVERAWPDTVRITVQRRSPVAAMPTATGDWILVDAEGVATEQVVEVSPALPVLGTIASGSLGSVQEDALPLLPLVAVLPDDLRPWIETLRLRDGATTDSLELDLVGSAVADLGDGRFLPEKLEALRAELSLVDLTCVVEFDVRVADFPTVRRDPDCEARRAATDSADGDGPVES